MTLYFLINLLPEKQSEMWKKRGLKKCFNLINPGGYLVTYCAKGVVKRTLKEVGFDCRKFRQVHQEKREMIRAKKGNYKLFIIYHYIDFKKIIY